MKRETNRATNWKSLFEEHHSQLTKIAEILLHRGGSPEQIAQTALAELEQHPLSRPLGTLSAFRSVVEAAIAFNYARVDSWIITTSSGPGNNEHSSLEPLESLPWAERAVYFLHVVLHYSKYDTALLLGIDESNVDELNKFAVKRMGISVGPIVEASTQYPSPMLASQSANTMVFTYCHEFRWPQCTDS